MKLCKDCKHCRLWVWALLFNYPYLAKCNLFATSEPEDLVFGRKPKRYLYNAVSLRQYSDLCGEEGKHWEEK
jgi:hypothetical protein